MGSKPVWEEEWGVFDALMGRVGFGRVEGRDGLVKGAGRKMVSTYAVMNQDFDAPARAGLAAAAPDLVRTLVPLLRWAERNIDKPVPEGGNQDAASFVRIWQIEKARAALRSAGLTEADIEAIYRPKFRS